jgi:glycosyltransferase involved in cell wall biosynthesis
LLQGSSVFVNCSAVPEALPLSVLEAMAQARPVVVPRWGVFPEIITDGVTGLLYCPGTLDELAQRILSLLRDPSLAEKIGCAGQLLVRDRFTEEKMVSGMREQYEQLLGCSSLRPS